MMANASATERQSRDGPQIAQCFQSCRGNRFLPKHSANASGAHSPSDAARHCRRGDRVRQREFMAGLGDTVAGSWAPKWDDKRSRGKYLCTYLPLGRVRGCDGCEKVRSNHRRGRCLRIEKISYHWLLATKAFVEGGLARPRVVRRRDGKSHERLVHPQRPRLDVADDDPRGLLDRDILGYLRAGPRELVQKNRHVAERGDRAQAISHLTWPPRR
jgi:hypothetical protein